jgi:hypothetical protein
MVLAYSSFVVRDDILSWGRVHRGHRHIAAPRFCDQLPALISAGESSNRLAIGLRRSYGDSCLNSGGAMIDMCGLDRFIAFDEASGTLRAEAGVSLSQILALTVPSGWFLSTTPGTRFVTLGGAVATTSMAKTTIGRAHSAVMSTHWAFCAATVPDAPSLGKIIAAYWRRLSAASV